MTAKSLLCAMATALFLVAACGNEFSAGSYNDGGSNEVSAAVDGPSGADGASKPEGLTLAGLTAVTVATSGGMPGPNDACRTDDTNVYSLDLQTRALSWQHCAIDPSTATASRKTETQLLTNYEVTAARLMLDLLSTGYDRTACGADKPLETIDLAFGDRIEKYQDDFYAGCPTYAPVDGRTYLHYVDWITNWLSALSQGLQSLPSTFISLAVVSDLDPFPGSAAMTAATKACGAPVNPSYNVTAATQEISWSSCVSGLTGYRLQTGNRVLSDSEFARVMQSWSAIQLGATGDCSTPRSLKSLQLTTAPGVYSYDYLNDFSACSRDATSAYSMYVVGLDDLAALLASLANGLSPSDAGVLPMDSGVELPGVFTPTGSMSEARYQHTATLLPNGKVLIAGGATTGPNGEMAIVYVTQGADLYDPATGTFASTGAMAVARYQHTATLLQNGKVLLTGGLGNWPQPWETASAELYDPASETFAATGTMTGARARHTGTRLPNGKVLIANGGSAELYDPSAGTFSATSTMLPAGDPHTATLLDNGKVLIAGPAGTELYDPTAGTFSATGAMTAARSGHTATLLLSGKVLITGGEVSYTPLASAELYDPTSGTFVATGTMSETKWDHAAALLQSGKVLIVGGAGSTSGLTTAELYDPGAGTFTATGNMMVGRYDHTATLLPLGEMVLVAGGIQNLAGAFVSLMSAELYE
jgi:hypothetical protein